MDIVYSMSVVYLYLHFPYYYYYYIYILRYKYILAALPLHKGNKWRNILYIMSMHQLYIVNYACYSIWMKEAAFPWDAVAPFQYLQMILSRNYHHYPAQGAEDKSGSKLSEDWNEFLAYCTPDLKIGFQDDLPSCCLKTERDNTQTLIRQDNEIKFKLGQWNYDLSLV